MRLQISYKSGFAYWPLCTTSGKWLWWKRYVKETRKDLSVYDDPIVNLYWTEEEYMLKVMVS